MKQFVVLLVLIQSFYYGMGQTPCPVLECKNGGLFNRNTCKCECYPAYNGVLCETLTCKNQPPVCEQFTEEICETPAYANLCPSLCGKCEPIPCPPCSNGGVLANQKTCECTCPEGYTGDRCQFSKDPCSVEDPDAGYCANIDCWANQPEEVLIKCQRKCFCCGNKKCFNLSRFITSAKDPNNKCECGCVNQAFDPQYNCEKPSATCADQFSVCPVVFGAQRCNDPTIFAYCPKMCGFC